jgi:hypothetical protein
MISKHNFTYEMPTISELSQVELDIVMGGAVTAAKLSATAGVLAGASLVAGGPTNPVGGALLAAAATTEMIAVVVSIFG